MIDTIVTRLHDLKKYDPLIRRLQLKNNKGYTLETGKVEADELRRLRNAGHKPKQIINIMKRNRTGRFIIKSQALKQVNRSSHYEFTYFINETGDFIEFNFSVPKYLYGSNVLQFIEHSRDVYYKLWDNGTFQVNMEKTPKYIMKFIGYFFWSEFILDKIDFRDVEINRFDLCFNQIFQSEKDVKQAFELLKNRTKKGSRDEEGTKSVYDSTIMFKTEGYSAKIYQKGPEYKKHELHEHQRINEEKRFQYFDTEKFQALANRTLRFEITFRSSEINYQFKHHIFRKDCPLFKIDYKNYQRIENKIQRNNRISKKIGTLPEKAKEAYRKLHPDERVSTEANNTHQYVSKLLSRKPQFMMKIDKIDELFNERTVDYPCKVALFSEEIIWLGLQKLLSFIKEFQLKELPNEETVGILIDRYNSTHSEQLQKGKMFQIYLLLLQNGGSFKAAIKTYKYSRATLYRYIDRFKEIGITENNIVPTAGDCIPKADFDFKQYHVYLMSNNLVRGIRIPNDPYIY